TKPATAPPPITPPVTSTPATGHPAAGVPAGAPTAPDRQPVADAVNRISTVSQPALPLQSFVFTTRKSLPSASNRDVIEERRTAYYPEDLGGGVTLRMVEIPRGSFLMGDPAPVTERPQHPVTIKSFFMDEFEVTQQQWRIVARLPKIK